MPALSPRRVAATASLSLLAALSAAASASAFTRIGADLTQGVAASRLDCVTWLSSLQQCTTVVTGKNNGSSAAVPSNGVLVSASLRITSNLGIMTGRIRVLHDAGGTPQQNGDEIVTFAGTSDEISVPTDGNEHELPLRMPVQAGDLLGFSSALGSLIRSQSCATVCGRVYNNGVDGTVSTFDAWFSPNFQAPLGGVVEADADGDGYGDESQDACPGNAARQAAPCVDAPPVQTQTQTVTVTTTTPTTPTTPTVDDPPDVKKVSVTGGKLRFTTDEQAEVTVKITRLLAGKRAGAKCVKPTSKLAKARACDRRGAVKTIRRTVAAGSRQIPLKTDELPAGKYEVRVVAEDENGDATIPIIKQITVKD